MIAYALQAHLQHLALAGQDPEDSSLCWIGTTRKWDDVEKAIAVYE